MFGAVFGGERHATFSVVSKSNICDAPYSSGGTCPRAVVGVLGNLLTDKLIVGAFLGPVFIMLGTILVRWVRPGHDAPKRFKMGLC